MLRLRELRNVIILKRLRKVAAELALPPPAPTFVPFRRKRLHFTPPPRPKHHKVAAVLAATPVGLLQVPFRRRRRRAPPVPVVFRRHRRSLAWLVVQAPAVFIPHKTKRKPAFRPTFRRRKARIAGIIGARAFLFPPSQAWNWNGQPAQLSQHLAPASKAWVWNPQPAALSFGLATASKAWVWAKNSAVLSFALSTGKAWGWNARAAVLAGGNISPLLKKGFDIMRGVMWGVMRGNVDRGQMY